MENITAKEPMTTGDRNKMALKNGLILGLIYIIISTGVNLAVNNMIVYFGLKFLAYILYVVILGLFAKSIRTANGGYIELKEIFGATFVTLFVAGLMVYIYYFIYMYYIDPAFIDKIKAATLAFYEKSNVPDDKLDEITENFNKQIKEAKSINLGKNILNFLGGLMLDCLFGLIVAAIVKKPRPMFEQM